MKKLKKYFAQFLYLSAFILVFTLIIAHSFDQAYAFLTYNSDEDKGLVIQFDGKHMFDIDNMYPGKEVKANVTVHNKSLEPFKFAIDATNRGGDKQFYNALIVNIANIENDIFTGPITELKSIHLGEIDAGGSENLKIAVTLSSNTGNYVQGKTTSVSWIFSADYLGNGEGPDLADPVDPGEFDIFDFDPEAETEDEAETPEVALLLAPPAAPTDDSPAEVPADQVVLTPEDPQVEPVDEVLGIVTYWPYWLLLLLLPLLFLFFFVRRVLVMVPGAQGEYKVVARKFAWRRDKKWFVDIEKQLDRYLPGHGLVVVDFRGALLKKGQKSIYAGKSVLGVSSLRYALIGSHRMVTWATELKDKHSRKVG